MSTFKVNIYSAILFLILCSITIVGSVMVQHLVDEIHHNSPGRTLITHSKGLEIPQSSPVVSINSLLPR